MEKSSHEDAQRAIAAKKKQLMKIDDKIYDMQKSVLKKAQDLKEQNNAEKSNRIRLSRNHSHNVHMEGDRELRPSDRGNDIRSYGKMDADIWKYGDLRDWFNKYAPPSSVDISDGWHPIESGYTIKMD